MFSGPFESEALVVGGVPDCSQTYPVIMRLAEVEKQLITSKAGPVGGDKVHSEEYGFWSQTFWLRTPGFPLALDYMPLNSSFFCLSPYLHNEVHGNMPLLMALVVNLTQPRITWKESQ